MEDEIIVCRTIDERRAMEPIYMRMLTDIRAISSTRGDEGHFQLNLVFLLSPRFRSFPPKAVNVAIANISALWIRAGYATLMYADDQVSANWHKNRGGICASGSQIIQTLRECMNGFHIVNFEIVSNFVWSSLNYAHPPQHRHPPRVLPHQACRPTGHAIRPGISSYRRCHHPPDQGTIHKGYTHGGIHMERNTHKKV